MTEEAANPERSRPAKKRSRWMLAVWISLGVLFGLVALYLHLLMRVPRLAAKWEAEARAELDALLGESVPDEENAAVVYREAAGVCKRWPDFEFSNRPEEWPWQPEISYTHEKVRENARIYIKANAGALRLVADAQKRPRCDWNPGRTDAVPPLLKMQTSANALVARARLAAFEGKYDAVVADIRSALRLNHDLSGPLINVILSVRIREAVLMGGVRGVLEDSRPPAGKLRKLLAVLETVESMTGMLLEALEQEQVHLKQYWADEDAWRELGGWLSTAEEMPGRPGTTRYTAVYRPFFMARDLRLYENEIDCFIEALRLPPWEARQTAEDIVSWVKNPSWWQKLSRTNARIYFSALHPNTTLCRHIHADAYLPLVRAAVACEIYEREHGEYPSSLDALVPGIIAKVPVDPFDGRPVRYRRKGKHLVLWSVGRDKKDAGGVERSPGSGEPDIVLELHAPKTETKTEAKEAP